MCDNYSENEESKDLNYFRIDNSKKCLDNDNDNDDDNDNDNGDNSMSDEKSIFSFKIFDRKIEEQFEKKKELNQQEFENIYNKYIKKNNEIQLEIEHNDENTGFTSKIKNNIKKRKNNSQQKLKILQNPNKNHEESKNVNNTQKINENNISKIKNNENENNQNIENNNIFNNIEIKSTQIKEKKNLGRKTKNSEKKKDGHNKYSDDNLIRNVKCTLLDVISSFINSLLKEFNKDIKKTHNNKKELLKMNQSQIINSKADYNQLFIYKSLEEILSDKISSKYTKYLPDHNKELIKSLLNNKNEELKIIFTDIFNLTFFNCLEHFRGSQKYPILEGLTNLDEICHKFKEEPDYVAKFKFYVNNFEKIINNKKVRNRISWKKEPKLE